MSSLFQRCQFCRKQIDSSKIMVHELYCERNCVKCERCGFMYDQTDPESHDEEFHKMQTCPHCKNEFQDLTKHHCDKEPIRCQYCQLDYVQYIYQDHLIQCGSRTERCHICQQYIILRNMETHLLTCQKNKIKDDFPTIQEVENRRMQELQQQKKIENQNKIPQKDSIYSREPIKQQQNNDVYDDRNKYNNQNLKKEIIPQQQKNDYMGQKQFQEQQVFQTQQNKPNEREREKIFQTSNDQQKKLYEDKRDTKQNYPNKVGYEEAQFSSNNQIIKSGITDKYSEPGKFAKNYESFKSQDKNLDQNPQNQQKNQQQYLQQQQQQQQYLQQQQQQQQKSYLQQNGATDLPLKNYKDSKSINNPNQYDDKRSQQLNQNDKKDYLKSNNTEKIDSRNQRQAIQSNQIPEQQYQYRGAQKSNNQPQIPTAIQKEGVNQSNNIYGQSIPAQNYTNQYVTPQNYSQDIPIQKQGSQNSYLQNKQEQPRNQQKQQPPYTNNYETPYNPQQNQEYFKQIVPSTNQTQNQFQQKQSSNIKQQPIETNQQIFKSTNQTKDQSKYNQRVTGSSIVKPDYNDMYRQKEMEEQNKNYYQQSYPESTIISNQPSQFRVPKNPNAYQETRFTKINEVQNNFQLPSYEEQPLPNDSMIARKLQEEFDLGMTQSTINEQTRQYQEFEAKKQAVTPNKPSIYDELKYQKKPKSPPPQRTPEKNIALENEFDYLSEDDRNLQIALIEAYERERLFRGA